MEDDVDVWRHRPELHARNDHDDDDSLYITHISAFSRYLLTDVTALLLLLCVETLYTKASKFYFNIGSAQKKSSHMW